MAETVNMVLDAMEATGSEAAVGWAAGLVPQCIAGERIELPKQLVPKTAGLAMVY